MDFEKLLTEKLKELPFTQGLDDGCYNEGQLTGFEDGARWAGDRLIAFIKWYNPELMDEAVVSLIDYFKNMTE